MFKTSCSPTMGWTKSLSLGALLAIWIVAFLIHFRSGTVDSGASQLPHLTSDGSSSPDASTRPLVLFTYAESDLARQNLEYFIKNGLHGKADFIFIFNGETSASNLVPDLPNVQVVKRDNTCYDMGAVGVVLTKDDLWKKYKRFITVNASVRGPFLPTHASTCWTDLFLNRITDKVKLVGTTINCNPRLHLQSMLLATDDVGMSILLDPSLARSVAKEDYYGGASEPVGFSHCYSTYHLAIHAEIGITTLIRSQGYDVNVVLTAPNSEPDYDYFCSKYNNPIDFLASGAYFGIDVHPYETVFMKANRGINPTVLARLTEWHLDGNMTSWKTCGY